MRQSTWKSCENGFSNTFYKRLFHGYDNADEVLKNIYWLKLTKDVDMFWKN